MKIRDGLARDDYRDPSPYKFPPGTVAYEVDTPAGAAGNARDERQQHLSTSRPCVRRVLLHVLGVLQVLCRGGKQEFMVFLADIADHEVDLLAATSSAPAARRSDRRAPCAAEIIWKFTKVGDKVEFEAEQAASGYTVTKLQKSN
jgi:hypothetical protein